MFITVNIQQRTSTEGGAVEVHSASSSDLMLLQRTKDNHLMASSCHSAAGHTCTKQQNLCLINTNYQIPNGPVKVEHRWGQRHPQGANLGSNGMLKCMSKTHTI